MKSSIAKIPDKYIVRVGNKIVGFASSEFRAKVLAMENGAKDVEVTKWTSFTRQDLQLSGSLEDFSRSGQGRPHTKGSEQQ